MAGETNVGGILGFLRLDATQFHREIETAIAEVDRLDGRDATVNVHADTTGAAAKIEATEKQVDRLDKSNVKVDKSSRDAGRGMGALATAIIGIGPAIVPLAAGAAGLGAALGGLGTAGVLAIVGIADEMKKGTALGLTYKSTLDDAKTSVMGLAKVAATNVLGPLQAAVKDLQDKTPQLTSIIGDFSTMAGKTAGNLTSGLLNAFIALEPLMRDAGVYIENLSRRFSDAMSGPGVVAFGDYVRSVFPQVMAQVENIVTAAVHLVAAFAPLGMGTLTLIGNLASLINLFPIDALSTIATLAGGVFAGFKTWQGLSGLVDGVSGALGRLGASAEVSATAVRGLQAAAGIVGVAIAGLSILMSTMSANSAQAEQSTNNFTDALIASNGALDDNVRKTAAKQLMDTGALDAAGKLGISQQLVTDAVIGVTGAHEELGKQLDIFEQKQIVAQQGADGTTEKMADQNNALVVLKGVVGDTSTQFANGAKNQRDYAAATKVVAGVTSDASVETSNLAATYGVSVPIFQSVADAQKKNADKAAAATLQMQLENNAAGLLKQSLDALNGKSLSAAQAQNAFDSSLANMGDHVTKTGKKVHFTTTSIKDMSTASVALRGQLLGQVTAAEQTAESYGQMTGSSEKGRKKLLELRDQIIKNAVAHGVDKDAVTAYVDSVLKVPKKVPPTKLETDKAEAEKKAKEFIGVINGIPTWRGTTLSVNVVSNVASAMAGIKATIGSTGSLFGWKPNAEGSLTLGNGVRAMAEGGMTGRDSMIMRSTKPILWNEAPGGEAYISLAPSKRARSQAIWAETGKALGMGAGGGGSAGGMGVSEMRMLARFIGAEFRSVRPVVDVDALSSRLVGGMSS